MEDDQITEQERETQDQLAQAQFLAWQMTQEQIQQTEEDERQAAANQRTALQKQEDTTSRGWWLVQMLAKITGWSGLDLGTIPGYDVLHTIWRAINTKFPGVTKIIPFSNVLAPAYRPNRRPEDIILIIASVAVFFLAIPIIVFIGLLFGVVGYVYQNPTEAATLLPGVVTGVIRGYIFN